MMKVYICPKCGWIRTVSRRNEVECFKCGNEKDGSGKDSL